MKTLRHGVTFLALVSLTAVGLSACAATSDDAADAKTGDDQEVVAGAPIDRATYAGSYEDKQQVGQDLGSIDLKLDGTYSARVLANVAGAKILCNRAPCNAEETGTWTASRSQDGIDRLRLKPAQTALRIYRLSRLADSGALFLERKESTQTLQLVAIPFTGPKCATIRCAPGTQCADTGDGNVACLPIAK